ncbi:cobalt-precorrin-6A reductase [Marihabitans asiaticum]|uniref:Precorrin-6A reductase n=1 Tax=Marihabitans asiaticum TaxID=415218 RepID=A0A560WGK4_9MICO|nr:cobalt-precorrin-6A reductase [Marihabitans asiaticum]TWD16686.1 precorrin-6A reductase [Marihabitans asiaticum]
MSVLLLGGTSEARELAALLVERDIPVLSSLAGRVARPRLPAGPVRIGGFGGVDGLRSALADHDLVVDATHPFARGMSANAEAACQSEGVPLLRLERPGWAVRPGWEVVPTHEAAAARASRAAAPLLTVGRQELARYLPALERSSVLARVVDDPDLTLPPTWRVVLSRGPYTLDSELELMREHGTDLLVTKNSGGTYTWPKMAAAEDLGVPVVVIARPAPTAAVPVVDSVTDALAWVQHRIEPQS